MPYENHPSGPLTPLQEVLTPGVGSSSSHREMRSSMPTDRSSTVGPLGPMSPDKELPIPPLARSPAPNHINIPQNLRRLASPRRDQRSEEAALPAPSRPWASPGYEPPPTPMWRMPSPTAHRHRSRGRSESRALQAWSANEGSHVYADKSAASTPKITAYRPPPPPAPGPTRPLTVAERLLPTLELARAEREKCARRARYTSWAVNVASALQILLGALTTGLAAAVTGREVSIITSIMGGLSTLVASFLARARGSNEPEGSRTKARALEHFIREVESVVLDRGWRVNAKLAGTPVPPESDAKDELDHLIDELRRRFEDIMGNLEERQIPMAP